MSRIHKSTETESRLPDGGRGDRRQNEVTANDYGFPSGMLKMFWSLIETPECFRA